MIVVNRDRLSTAYCMHQTFSTATGAGVEAVRSRASVTWSLEGGLPYTWHWCILLHSYIGGAGTLKLKCARLLTPRFNSLRTVSPRECHLKIPQNRGLQLLKCEDLNLFPKTHIQSQELWHTVVIPALGGQRLVDFWGSLVSQPTLIGEIQASEGACLRKQGGRYLGNDTPG